eukprot:360432-Chlamydomonas_euryale.AAC.5
MPEAGMTSEASLTPEASFKPDAGGALQLWATATTTQSTTQPAAQNLQPCRGKSSTMRQDIFNYMGHCNHDTIHRTDCSTKSSTDRSPIPNRSNPQPTFTPGCAPPKPHPRPEQQLFCHSHFSQSPTLDSNTDPVAYLQARGGMMPEAAQVAHAAPHPGSTTRYDPAFDARAQRPPPQDVTVAAQGLASSHPGAFEAFCGRLPAPVTAEELLAYAACGSAGDGAGCGGDSGFSSKAALAGSDTCAGGGGAAAARAGGGVDAEAQKRKQMLGEDKVGHPGTAVSVELHTSVRRSGKHAASGSKTWTPPSFPQTVHVVPPRPTCSKRSTSSRRPTYPNSPHYVLPPSTHPSVQP